MPKKSDKKILVIGDPHCNQNRKKSWVTACESILSITAKQSFDYCVITGDLFDETPTIEERVLLAKFIKQLASFCSKIILIKGTDTHEFTKGYYNFEDIILLSNIEAFEEFELGKFTFGHYEVKGTHYINGFLSKSEKVADPKRVYILGHIHQPTCSFDNINYVGSMYKTDFSEIQDQKRIAIILGDKIKWHDIESRPMYQVTLVGKDGAVKVCQASKDFLLKTPEKTEMDLKIVVETDSVSLGVIDRQIAKIKEKFNIEYYIQEKNIKDINLDIPKNLDKNELLKDYCDKKQIPFELVLKELNK